MADIAEPLNGIVDGPFGSNLKKADYIDDCENGIPVLTTKNLHGDYSKDSVRYVSKEKYEALKRSTVYPGDILVAKIGSIGVCGIYPLSCERALIPANLLKITVLPTVDRKYVYYYIKSRGFQERIKAISTATAQPAFNVTKFRKLPIPVPSLDNQKRIVARIEELFSQLDSGVETLRKTKQQLAVYRQAVLSEAFSRLDDMRKITDFFEISGGLTKNSARDSYTFKMPYLRVANVYYNSLDLSEIRRIGVKVSEVDEKLLKKNDLLFVEGNGSKAQIGRVAIWDGSIDPCLHQNHIIKGRPTGAMLSKYALFYLISGFGREQILRVASSTSGLYTLSTGKIENLLIPYCSIQNQRDVINRIEEKLSVCVSIEKTVDTALQQAEAMRQSFLKQAFETI